MSVTEAWIDKLQSGRIDDAWDDFITLHRNLIFKAIRHYADGYDDVMDVFAHVCESLREDDLARIRKYLDQPEHTARLTTWLVSVVRNLTVDWFRKRDGRKRPSKIIESLPKLQQEIFELVAKKQLSHREAFETLNASAYPEMTLPEFHESLRELHRALEKPGRGVVYRELIGIDLIHELGGAVEEMNRDEDEMVARLAVAMERLSPEDRSAVMLFCVHGMGAKDVAKTLGWPGAKTVYNRVSRSLNRLKVELGSGANLTDSAEESEGSSPSNIE